jgi:hypothetical protein
MKRAKHARIQIPIYRGRLYVVHGTPDQCNAYALRSHGHKLGADELDEGACFVNSRGELVLAFVHIDPNTVAHECVHAAWIILKSAGVIVTQNNDETLAYLTGELVELVTRRLAE